MTLALWPVYFLNPQEIAQKKPVIQEIEQRELPAQAELATNLKESKRIVRLPFFDSENRLRCDDQTFDIFIQGVCDSPPSAIQFGTETNRTLMLNPRVDLQDCPPSEKFPKVGNAIMVGLDGKGKVRWSRSLSLSAGGGLANAEAAMDTCQLLGASPIGIILRSRRAGAIEIVSPQTGESTDYVDKPWSKSLKNLQAAAFDPISQSLYIVALTYTTNSKSGDSSSLYRVNWQTGEKELLIELPKHPVAPIPFSVEQLLLSEKRGYLIVVGSFPFKGESWYGFQLFDLKSKQFIFKKDAPAWTRGYAVLGRFGHFGFLSRVSGKDSLSHFVLHEE